MQRAIYVAMGALVLAALSIGVLYRTHMAPAAAASFAGVSLTLDYATTEAARVEGLSGRVSVPENRPMLFVFPQDGYWGIWMKDMRVPLDIFWLDDERRVVWVAADVATSTYPRVFKPPLPARYVLETAAGFAARHHVATGTPLELARPVPAWAP